MNYQRLDRPYATNGFSEGVCNYRVFESRNNGRNLVHGSNVGIKGRHVYELTNKECFKPTKDVLFASTYATTSSNYGLMGVNFEFPGKNIVEKPNVILMEMVTFNFPNSICLSYMNIFNPRISATLSYILGRQSTPYYLSIQVNAIAVFGEVEQDDTFQYGIIKLQSFTHKLLCESFMFPTSMNAKPTIKLTADVGTGNNPFAKHANVWLRNVTNSGFMVCYKESMAYSGSRNISVHYVAIAKEQHNVTEHGTIMFSRGSSWSCRKFFYKFKYLGNPRVFVTPEEVPLQETRGVLVSWVKATLSTYVEICAMHPDDGIRIRERDVKVNYIVQGQISPCTYVTCPDHLQCRVHYRNGTYCGCIERCTDVSPSDTICGTDFVTYASICHMYKDRCERYGTSFSTTVKVAHMGKCERK